MIHNPKLSKIGCTLFFQENTRKPKGKKKEWDLCKKKLIQLVFQEKKSLFMFSG